MTLTLAVAFNVVAMVSLAGALAYAMSHAARLRPHQPAAAVPVFRPIPVTRSAPVSRTRRPTGALAATAS